MPTKDKEKLANLFKPYGQLSDECLDSLVPHLEPATFKAGQTIVAQGKPCGKIFFVKKGLCRILYNKDGKEDTVCFGSENEMFISFHDFCFGEAPVLALEAIDYEVTGWFMKISRFKEVEELFPELYKTMHNYLVHQLYSLEILYRKLSLSTPEEKYENFLHLATPNLKRLPRKDLSRRLPLKYLAQYLGFTPQTLSRVRRKFIGR